MTNLLLNTAEVKQEIERITRFIEGQRRGFPLLIGLSGGVDSDVTARLCRRVVPAEQLKCFLVLQEDFEQKYIDNARELARELGCRLVELSMPDVPRQLIQILSDADPLVGFRASGLLDVARSKCALRTFVFSAYSERGYLVVGPSNRTELSLGYFLPFGDGLSHFAPIAHLYKSQVQQLAQELGTSKVVTDQEPAAGFWNGDSDLDGIAYWLFNGAPIEVELDMSTEGLEEVGRIRNEISFEALDTCLDLLQRQHDPVLISEQTGLSETTVVRVATLMEAAGRRKRLSLGARLN
jgi:NAD+ synthase